MRTLLQERYAPVTSAVGYLELPVSDAVAGLEKWRQSLYPNVKTQRLKERFPEAIHRLEPLTSGARPRELLVSAGTWTAYFDNALRGGDPISTIGFLSQELQCQGLAIEVFPHTIGLAGVRQGRSGAVQFTLFGPLKTHFLNYVRTVSVVFDGGRWVFNAIGTEQAFEEPAAYSARRVRDRFTSQMLERYCQALGVDVFKAGAYGPEAVLVESAVQMPPNGVVMTLAEAQAWLEVTPGRAEQLPG